MRGKHIMKAKLKEIKDFIDWTPKELKGKQISELGLPARYMGYFAHSGTNWSYRVHALLYKNNIIEVVTVFGMIQ